MKKLKLESNFYSMYRNLFKILINKQENKDKKKNIIDILNDITQSYWEKKSAIQKEIEEIFNGRYINWSIIEDINVFPDDLIQCLGLNDNDCEKPRCFKSGDTCQFVIPKFNLLYEEEEDKKENQILYKLKLGDEIVRYGKIREYILKNDVFLNFDNVEYKINDDEIVIIKSMFDKLYINDIDEASHSEHITNYTIYDNINDSKIVKGNRKLKLVFSDDESADEIQESDSDSDDDKKPPADDEKKDDEEKNVERPKVKKRKSTKKVKGVDNKTRKFIGFLMWYEYLKGNKNIDKNMSIDEFKKIDIVKKWLKIAEPLFEKKIMPKGLNTIYQFNLENDWKSSIFKEYRLSIDEEILPWEKIFINKYSSPNFPWNMNSYYKNGPGRFFRSILTQGNKVQTLDELLEYFKNKVIYTENGKKELDKLNIKD